MRLSNPMRRLNAGLLIIAFVLSLFAGRLVQLQAIKGEEYSEAAIKQRLRDIDLPASARPDRRRHRRDRWP